MSKEVSRVLVLGYGEMGHAMQHLLAVRRRLSFWDPYQPALPALDLEQSAAASDVVLFCLPVNPHLELALRIAPVKPAHCICLSVAKGLDERGKTAAQCFAEAFDEDQYGLLYGPMISEEICASRDSFAQLGCRDAGVYHRIKRLFAHTCLHIRQTMDIAGISWSVILKNVYAIGFGAADEMKLGDNMRGLLAVEAARELNGIVQALGGRHGTAWQLAGLGDLITTATSAGSHHHELGRKLARGELQDISGEGIHTLKMVARYRIFDTAAFPLFRLMQHIVEKPDDMREAFRQYLRVSFGAENA